MLTFDTAEARDARREWQQHCVEQRTPPRGDPSVEAEYREMMAEAGHLARGPHVACPLCGGMGRRADGKCPLWDYHRWHKWPLDPRRWGNDTGGIWEVPLSVAVDGLSQYAINGRVEY